MENCIANIKEDGAVSFSFYDYNGHTKKFTGSVDNVDAENVTIYTEKEIDVYNVTELKFLVERTTFQMEYRALEMLEHSIIKKVFFADSYTGNRSLDFSK